MLVFNQKISRVILISMSIVLLPFTATAKQLSDSLVQYQWGSFPFTHSYPKVWYTNGNRLSPVAIVDSAIGSDNAPIHFGLYTDDVNDLKKVPAARTFNHLQYMIDTFHRNSIDEIGYIDNKLFTAYDLQDAGTYEGDSAGRTVLVISEPVLINGIMAKIVYKWEEKPAGEAIAKNDFNQFQAIVRSFRFTKVASASSVSSPCSTCTKDPAQLYLEGRVAYDNQDYQTAHGKFRFAAEAGLPDAQYDLGWMYRDKIVVGKKGEETQLFKNAFTGLSKIKNPDPETQFRLGRLLSEGIGTTKNIKTARAWFKKAAARGNVKAQHTLGLYSYEGKGVKKNVKDAFIRFKKSANQGYYLSEYIIGYMYVNGEGTKKNPIEGAAWLILAGKQNMKIAMDAQKVINLLSPIDLQSARARADVLLAGMTKVRK